MTFSLGWHNGRTVHSHFKIRTVRNRHLTLTVTEGSDGYVANFDIGLDMT